MLNLTTLLNSLTLLNKGMRPDLIIDELSPSKNVGTGRDKAPNDANGK